MTYHLDFGWAGGGLSRRRPLLRPERIPHHQPSDRGALRPQGISLRRFWVPPSPPFVPGAAGHAGGSRSLRDRSGVPGWSSKHVAGRHRRNPVLLRQLALHRIPQLLLCSVPCAVASGAHVVTRHRGAVLRRVARWSSSPSPSSGAADGDGIAICGTAASPSHPPWIWGFSPTAPATSPGCTSAPTRRAFELMAGALLAFWAEGTFRVPDSRPVHCKRRVRPAACSSWPASVSSVVHHSGCSMAVSWQSPSWRPSSSPV